MRLSARAKRAITAVTDIAEALAELEAHAAQRDRYGVVGGIQRQKPTSGEPGDPLAAALARKTRKELNAALGGILSCAARARYRVARCDGMVDKRRDRHDYGGRGSE